MRKLRIAYFAGTMKPGQDGVTRVLFKLLDWLNSNEIENMFVTAIAPKDDEQTTKYLRVPSVQFPLYKEYKFALPGYKNFQEEILNFNPDIIHINSPCSLGFAAVKFGEKFQIPVVATYHTHFPSYAKYYKISQLESLSWSYLRKLYNKCEKVFVPSLPILNELHDHGFTSAEYLSHGVDTKMFNQSFKSAEWKNALGLKDKKIILYVGRLVWEKDLKTFTEIYSQIMSSRNDTIFVLAGDGPIRTDLEELMPDAKFLGYQSGNNLSTIFASSDVFVFPSTTETFGNVIIEAMASGVPPVCARMGGTYGSVNENISGLICNPKDSFDFTNKINYLLDNEDERLKMSLAGIRYAKEQSWEIKFTQLYKSYFEAILNYGKRKTHSTLAA